MTFDQIISWGIPFASGAAGVYAGLKVGIARLEANYSNLRGLVEETKMKLREQVGETRCREYREDCRDNVHCRLDAIFDKLEKLDRSMVEIALKIAKIEAKANGT